MMQFVILVIVGFLMGIVTIAFGGGCGAVYVAVLTLLFNISPAVATSTSLATMFPTAAVAAFSHWKVGNVNIRTGLIMMGGGVVGSVISSLCSGFLPTDIYNKLIGGVIVLLSVLMIISVIRKKYSAKAGAEKKEQETKRNIMMKAIAFGVIGGVISGLVGTSGTTAIVAGLTVLGCTALEVVGTSVFVLAGISIAGFVIRLGVGNVDWTLVLLLTSGAVIGAVLGSIVLKRIKKGDKNGKTDKVLQPILISGNLAIGILQLLK